MSKSSKANMHGMSHPLGSARPKHPMGETPMKHPLQKGGGAPPAFQPAGPPVPPGIAPPAPQPMNPAAPGDGC